MLQQYRALHSSACS